MLPVPTTNELLRLPPSPLLKTFGIADRAPWIGMSRTMKDCWISTVGHWSGGTWGPDVATGRPLFHRTVPSQGRIKVLPGTLSNFKHRHALLSPAQFRVRFGVRPWLRAENSFVAVHEELERMGYDAPLGEAAQVVVASRRGGPDNLGMLPVEIVLWCRAFHRMLAMFALTHADWRELSGSERLDYWMHWTQNDRASNLQLFLDEPAALSLREDGETTGRYPSSYEWRPNDVAV